MFADPERVNHEKLCFEKKIIEMDPCDVLYFHCNLLRTSGPNLSPDPRWVLIFCYNVARNNHFRESDHPFYTPLEKVEDNQIKEKVEKYFLEDQV